MIAPGRITPSDSDRLFTPFIPANVLATQVKIYDFNYAQLGEISTSVLGVQ